MAQLFATGIYTTIWTLPKTFARGSMNYIYERRLSPCLENHFPAACSFSVNSLCRAVYLGGFADTHTRTFLQVLDEASSFQSSIFLALCDTGYYRNCFFGAMGCKTLSQGWRLAGGGDVFYSWIPALFIRFCRWFFSQVGRGLIFLGGRSCLTLLTSKPV